MAARDHRVHHGKRDAAFTEADDFIGREVEVAVLALDENDNGLLGKTLLLEPHNFRDGGSVRPGRRQRSQGERKDPESPACPSTDETGD
jgi:hypothetical protein